MAHRHTKFQDLRGSHNTKCAQHVLHVFHATNSKNLDHLEGVPHATGVAGICRTVGVGHCRHTKAATSAAVFASAALSFQRHRSHEVPGQNGVKHTPKQCKYGRDGACCVCGISEKANNSCVHELGRVAIMDFKNSSRSNTCQSSKKHKRTHRRAL